MQFGDPSQGHPEWSSPQPWENSPGPKLRLFHGRVGQRGKRRVNGFKTSATKMVLLVRCWCIARERQEEAGPARPTVFPRATPALRTPLRLGSADWQLSPSLLGDARFGPKFIITGLMASQAH